MKERFTKWMREQTRNNGKPYKDSTINRYVRALGKICEQIQNLQIESTNLFFYTNLDDFRSVDHIIRTNDDFERVNRASGNGNGDLSAGMTQYLKFLEAECQSSSVPKKEKKAMDKPVIKKSISEILRDVTSYITSKGFSFSDALIKNFYLSLRAKPFVILAGTSGTGKTKLVELFAEAIGATADNGRYLLVPVRPDWSDSTDLLGHMNLNGEFVPGAIADFVYQANHNPDQPFFLCLDEMNLARVEYYLSDVLSIIETRKVRNDGRIGSLPLFTSNTFNDDTRIVGTDILAKEKYADIYLSENLFIIGTVNMDETTFPFSKKVLDRANTIEFSKVDTLVPDFEAIFKAKSDSTGPVEGVTNDFLRARYTKIEECQDMQEKVIADCIVLQELNLLLEKAEAHVGYRVRDEIEFYLLYSREDGGIIPLDEAFDNEIMQKILPRIQGSGMEVLALVESLIDFCGSKYSKSKAKLEAMKARCGEYGEGYTSYWL